MVYCRDGKNAVRGIIKESPAATTATTTAIFMAIHLIMLYAGNAQFPHLLVLADGCLRKPSPADKQCPEGQSQESHAKQDERKDNCFYHDGTNLAF